MHVVQSFYPIKVFIYLIVKNHVLNLNVALQEEEEEEQEQEHEHE